MKLSVAIRLGALIRPQCSDWMFWAGGSCVLGAAVEAVGLLTYDPFYRINWLKDVPPAWHLGDVTACPLCDSFGERRLMLAHLNDHHRLTRGRIADYVEQWERAQDEPAHTPETTTVGASQ